jgi:hypothetical protein
VSVFPSSFPARPPSEVEWEDLLVRLEITPRALRLAVEDAGGDTPKLRGILAGIVAHEERLAELLDHLRQRRDLPGHAFVGLGAIAEAPAQPAAGLAAAFTRLRDRNFAQVQRRGLEVWDWASSLDGHPVTAYQVLQWTARMDGELLAALRASGGKG